MKGTYVEYDSSKNEISSCMKHNPQSDELESEVRYFTVRFMNKNQQDL